MLQGVQPFIANIDLEVGVMDLQLRSRNFKIDDTVQEYATKKFNRLDRLLPDDSHAEIEVSSSSTRAHSDLVKIQATIKSRGTILRAEQLGPNAKASIDAVVDILERKIAKFKSQTYRSKRAKNSTPFRVLQAEAAEQTIGPEEGEILADGTLVRLKRFSMEPMTLEEAAWQMEMVGHSFYMFLNDESSQHNVLYRRDDGNYGLIQPIEVEQASGNMAREDGESEVSHDNFGSEGNNFGLG